MDRRLGGLAVLAVLLTGLLCVPGLIGRTTAGQGVPAVRLAPRPLPGQCLAPLDVPSQLNTVVDVVPIVACTVPHSAEILLVRTLDPADWPRRPQVTDAGFTNGALSQDCNERAAKYLGWGTRNPQDRVSVSFFTRLTVPDELDWSLGHRWYTCELMPGSLDFPIRWVGTARNAGNATPPAPFAKCADAPGGTAVSCDRPHHAEQLTQTFGSAQRSAPDCTVLAARVIGTPDPTFGGRLAVVAQAAGGGTACWVTTTSAQALVGTVINLGSAPLPRG